MRSIVLALMVMACGAPKSEQVYAEVDIDEYTGLDTEGLSWTYRDDGDMETSPDKDSLLRSRHVGGGELDFRRGSRWADGDAAGIVRFAQNDRVRIVEWNLNGVEGNGDYPLGVNQPKEGDESTTEAGSAWSTVQRRSRPTTAPTRTSSAFSVRARKVRWATGTSPRTWVSWPTTGTTTA